MHVQFAWLANLLLVVGALCLSKKYRWPFVCTISGECIYIVVAFARCQWDWAFICVVFAVLAIRNFLKWSPKP